MTLSTRPGALAVWATLAYVAWLRFGTRTNPPVAYEDFKSGLTFDFVRELLGHEQDAAYQSGQYMFVGRSTVLGRWRQLKQEQYQRYVDGYRDDADDPELPY